jgi:putative membrane protein
MWAASAEGQQTRKLGVPQNPAAVKAPDETDKAFMKQAAIGDAAEIELGQMAQAKATDPKVKQFGERMVKDHSQADDQLKGIAQSQHVSLPTELDPPHKSAKAMLSKKAGAQFDEAYMRLMVQDHTKTVNKFKREAAASHDPTVKRFAQQSLPILESHLQEARQVQGQLKSSGQ